MEIVNVAAEDDPMRLYYRYLEVERQLLEQVDVVFFAGEWTSPVAWEP